MVLSETERKDERIPDRGGSLGHLGQGGVGVDVGGLLGGVEDRLLAIGSRVVSRSRTAKSKDNNK